MTGVPIKRGNVDKSTQGECVLRCRQRSGAVAEAKECPRMPADLQNWRRGTEEILSQLSERTVTRLLPQNQTPGPPE